LQIGRYYRWCSKEKEELLVVLAILKKLRENLQAQNFEKYHEEGGV
jgi:hypothetical protein